MFFLETAVTAALEGKVGADDRVAELLLPAVEAVAGDEMREAAELRLRQAAWRGVSDADCERLGAEANRLHAACGVSGRRLAAAVHAHLSRLRAPDDERRLADAAAAVQSRKRVDAQHKAMEEAAAAKRAAKEAMHAAAAAKRVAAEAEKLAFRKRAADAAAAESAPPLTPELGELWERTEGRRMPRRARVLLRLLITTGAVGEELRGVIPFSANNFLKGCTLEGLRAMLPPGLASAAGADAGNAATMNVRRRATTVFRGLMFLFSAFTRPSALVATVESELAAANPTAQYRRLGGRTGCPGDQANAAPFVPTAALDGLRGLQARGGEVRPLALLAALLAKERDVPIIPSEAPASAADFEAAEAALEAVSRAFIKAGERAVAASAASVAAASAASVAAAKLKAGTAGGCSDGDSDSGSGSESGRYSGGDSDSGGSGSDSGSDSDSDSGQEGGVRVPIHRRLRRLGELRRTRDRAASPAITISD